MRDSQKIFDENIACAERKNVSSAVGKDTVDRGTFFSIIGDKKGRVSKKI